MLLVMSCLELVKKRQVTVPASTGLRCHPCVECWLINASISMLGVSFFTQASESCSVWLRCIVSTHFLNVPDVSSDCERRTLLTAKRMGDSASWCRQNDLANSARDHTAPSGGSREMGYVSCRKCIFVLTLPFFKKHCMHDDAFGISWQVLSKNVDLHTPTPSLTILFEWVCFWFVWYTLSLPQSLQHSLYTVSHDSLHNFFSRMPLTKGNIYITHTTMKTILKKRVYCTLFDSCQISRNQE